jgi:hypothetical protein
VKGALLVLLLALAACGGRAPAGPPPPLPDETFNAAARAGRVALERDRPAEAVRLYRAALTRARERDDAGNIADAGLGLAAAELARGRAADALATAREVRGELARREAPEPAALPLVEALALFRTGEAVGAERLAREVAGRRAEDADAARRAWFLLGLIAAGQRDAARLAEARAALSEPVGRSFQADLRELEAAAALLSGDADAARRLAGEAATLRRDSLDYRGLGRALALEAEAARAQGDGAAAADLLLRAGRGATTRGEWSEGRRWLAEAERLARASRRADIAAAARRALAALEERARDA